MYRLATKRTEKTSQGKREREFIETHTTTPTLVCSMLLLLLLLLTEIVRGLVSHT